MMKLKIILFNLFYILFIQSAFSQNITFMPKDYEKNYFDYSEAEELKPLRNDFRWINKIGFDSIAVEAGFNNRQFVELYNYPEITCNTGTCNPSRDVYKYKIINFHASLISYDFLSDRIILLKGISFLRYKTARDYIPLFGAQYIHYSERSTLTLQVPILLGYKVSNFNLFGGISINTYKFYRYENKDIYHKRVSRSTDFDFSINPALRFGYIKKFKPLTGGAYLGADLNDKYYLFIKLGLQVFVK